MYKWTKKDKDKIIKWTDKIKTILNMDSWNVYHHFIDGTAEAEQDYSGRSFLWDANNAVTQSYEKISIDWCSPLLKELRDNNKNYVIETITHELIHGLTQALYDLSLDRFVSRQNCVDEVERLTQRITKIVCTKILINQKL